jgi:hypothetical protein
MGRVVANGAAQALGKAAGNTLVLVVGVGVSVCLYKLYKAAAIDAVVNVSKAPSRATVAAIDSLTRSYDKTANGYEHRIGSAAWLRNLGSQTPTSSTGSWKPLRPEYIIVPNDSDVPVLDSVWVPAKPQAVVKPWYKTLFEG